MYIYMARWRWRQKCYIEVTMWNRSRYLSTTSNAVAQSRERFKTRINRLATATCIQTETCIARLARLLGFYGKHMVKFRVEMMPGQIACTGQVRDAFWARFAFWFFTIGLQRDYCRRLLKSNDEKNCVSVRELLI